MGEVRGRGGKGRGHLFAAFDRLLRGIGASFGLLPLLAQRRREGWVCGGISEWDLLVGLKVG